MELFQDDTWNAIQSLGDQLIDFITNPVIIKILSIISAFGVFVAIFEVFVGIRTKHDQQRAHKESGVILSTEFKVEGPPDASEDFRATEPWLKFTFTNDGRTEAEIRKIVLRIEARSEPVTLYSNPGEEKRTYTPKIVH